jgi:hypothetical protein
MMHSPAVDGNRRTRRKNLAEKERAQKSKKIEEIKPWLLSY